MAGHLMAGVSLVALFFVATAMVSSCCGPQGDPVGASRDQTCDSYTCNSHVYMRGGEFYEARR